MPVISITFFFTFSKGLSVGDRIGIWSPNDAE
jgi:hypothetical protein